MDFLHRLIALRSVHAESKSSDSDEWIVPLMGAPVKRSTYEKQKLENARDDDDEDNHEGKFAFKRSSVISGVNFAKKYV